MKLISALLLMLVLSASYGHAQMYRWVDEKGTVHFTDDPSRIPDRYKADTETRTTPKEKPVPEVKEKPVAPVPPKSAQPEGFEVGMIRRGEIFLVAVLLNGRVKRQFIIDTGASFTLIDQKTARELGITVDENTPFMPIATASDVIFTPLVTLKSVRVGEVEAESVDTLVYNMPGDDHGLLGNSFLSRFKVVLDSLNGKMTLHSLQGKPSLDRPGGYGRDFWAGRFRFYHRVLGELRRMKGKNETESERSRSARIDSAIRYFENQLSELDRRASLAGVPRQWRE